MTEQVSHRRLNAEELFSTLSAAEQAHGLSRAVAMLQVRDHIAALEDRIAALMAERDKMDVRIALLEAALWEGAYPARAALAETEAPDA